MAVTNDKTKLAPGKTVAHIHLEDLVALHATTAQAFLLASHLHVLDAPGVPAELTRSLRGLVLALHNRLQVMPAYVPLDQP